MEALLIENGDNVTVTVSGEADGVFVPISSISAD